METFTSFDLSNVFYSDFIKDDFEHLLEYLQTIKKTGLQANGHIYEYSSVYKALEHCHKVLDRIESNLRIIYKDNHKTLGDYIGPKTD